MPKIRVITENKKQFLPLLLEADPDEAMIDRYLQTGEMYIWEEDGEALAVCVVKDLDDGTCELKNIASDPKQRGRGHGGALLEAVLAAQMGRFSAMLVGTTTPMLQFYRRHGFVDGHVLRNFFVDNYPEPVYENGVRCVDMLYLKRRLLP